MHTEEDQLILSFLPSDIIRKIIKIGYEYVDELRLVSPLWNSLALDHFSKLPILKWLRVRPTGHYSSEPALPEKFRVNKGCSRIERLETGFTFLNQRKFYTAFKYSMTGVIVDELYLHRKYLWDFDMSNILTALDDLNVINLVMFSSNVYMQDFVEPIIIAARRVSTIELKYEPIPYAPPALGCPISNNLWDSWRELNQDLNTSSEVEAVLESYRDSYGNLLPKLTIKS